MVRLIERQLLRSCCCLFALFWQFRIVSNSFALSPLGIQQQGEQFPFATEA